MTGETKRGDAVTDRWRERFARDRQARELALSDLRSARALEHYTDEERPSSVTIDTSSGKLSVVTGKHQAIVMHENNTPKSSSFPMTWAKATRHAFEGIPWQGKVVLFLALFGILGIVVWRGL